VRSPRAFVLTGLGISGSLVAGAAILFVLASAYLAFHGWPLGTNGASEVTVTLHQEVSSHSSKGLPSTAP